MKPYHLALALLMVACSFPPTQRPTAGAEGFDGEISGFRPASTGGSGPHATWQVLADATAISLPNVVALTAPNHDVDHRFNLFWTDGDLADGRIAVAVRADGGIVDQGGGPMWRVLDADNYYLCRFNPLESNFRVYVVKDGVRRQLATALADVAVGTWHRVEATFVGDRITCSLDGRVLLEARDATIRGGGGHGLWTKADARTTFDDLFVGAVR